MQCIKTVAKFVFGGRFNIDALAPGACLPALPGTRIPVTLLERSVSKN